MKRLKNRILKLRIWTDTSGQDLVEYALLAGMVAVAAVACLPQLNTMITAVFSKISALVTSTVG